MLDTRQIELAPALRDGGPIDRHLLFEAGPFEVDLAFVEGGALVGQVLAEEEASAAGEPSGLEDAVCVLLGDGDARESALHTNGDFRFERVEPGRYALFVEAREVRVVVPEIDLSRSA